MFMMTKTITIIMTINLTMKVPAAKINRSDATRPRAQGKGQVEVREPEGYGEWICQE
jgi:hypothetical protein